MCTSKAANILQCAAAAVSGVRTAVSTVQSGVTEVKTGVTELKTDSRQKNAAGKLVHYKLFMYYPQRLSSGRNSFKRRKF